MVKQKAKPTPDRNDMWTVIRQSKTFTLAGLAHETGIRLAEVKGYVWVLVKSGYVKAHRAGSYMLVHDTGATPPDIAKEAKLPSGHQRMWMAMKVLKHFSPLDLALPAEVTAKAAQQYCSLLRKADYLAVRGANQNSRDALYVFNRKKDTGFHAPIIRRTKSGKVVFDRNLGRVVWPESEAA